MARNARAFQLTTGATKKFSDAELPTVLQTSPSIRTRRMCAATGSIAVTPPVTEIALSTRPPIRRGRAGEVGAVMGNTI